MQFVGVEVPCHCNKFPLPIGSTASEIMLIDVTPWCYICIDVPTFRSPLRCNQRAPSCVPSKISKFNTGTYATNTAKSGNDGVYP